VTDTWTWLVSEYGYVAMSTVPSGYVRFQEAALVPHETGVCDSTGLAPSCADTIASMAAYAFVPEQGIFAAPARAAASATSWDRRRCQ